jgi:hypothetical protein
MRSLGAIAAVLLSVPGAVWGRSAPSCGPALALRGDRRDVAQLWRALGRYDAQPGRPVRCPAGDRRWSVSMWRTGSRFTLEIADGAGLVVVRQVGGVDAAAAVVDSWLHRELRGGWRAGHAAIFAAAVVHPIPAAATPAAGDPAAVASVRPWPSLPPEPVRPIEVEARRIEPTAVQRRYDGAAAPAAAEASSGAATVTLGPEVALGSDGSRWWGAKLGFCAHVARFCAGAIARADVGTAIVGDPGTTRRYTGDLLGSLDLPLALGRVTLVPGVGLGLGALRANTSDPGSPPGEVSGARASTTWGLRAMARAVVSIPISRRFGVDIGSAFDLPWPARAAASDGQGGAYPADPRFFLRGDVTLRYGRP